ncbi:MAG: 4Fe-4S binding protein [Sphaerochaeta sp.]|nr:4Fe-4S binding protein [Spirochaetales bacterium]
MKKVIQRSVQVLTLLLFALLLIQGKVQVWMLIFGGSTLLALLFSRFYCGWICPINTIIRPISWVKKKLKIKRQKMPSWIESGVLRIIVLVLFLATMVFVLRTGKKLPVLPALLGIGVVLSIFFDEALWHRHLCPYGTILSAVGRFSYKSMKIEEDLCNNCQRCTRVCPSNAIVKEEKHQIVKAECLVCHECERVCNKDAIIYR